MLQNCTTYKILNVFFDDPLKKFGLKEISRVSKIAHTSVKNELKKLIRGGLIKKEIEIKGKRKFPVYFSNVNEQFTILKKISNEYLIRQSGLIEYLKKNIMPDLIVLFGSFSQGEDIKDSDIDLFIGSKPKEIDLVKFEKMLGHKINLIFKQDINLLKKEFLNNILNGTLLYGVIKIK